MLALLGFVVAAVVVGAGALVASRRPVALVDQSVPGPVLLVPGYGGSQQSLSSLAASLRVAGRDATVVTLPGQGQGDIVEQAAAVGQAADEALARTGAMSVDVVGYSAGGVVTRVWLLEGGAGRVRRVVTLGSPHNGTDVASVGSLVSGTCPTACQQLAPGSALLSRLAATPVPVDVAFLSLWTTRDEVVVPPESSVVDGEPSPSLQSICASSTTPHGGLPSDQMVQRIVAEALGAGPVPELTSADCDRLSQ